MPNNQDNENKHTGKKVGLATLLGGAVAVEGIKNILFGKPRKNWRKAVVYGALAGYTFLKMCGDEVNTAYNKTQDLLESRRTQKIEQLEQEKDSIRQHYQSKAKQLRTLLNEEDVERNPTQPTTSMTEPHSIDAKQILQRARSGEDVNWYSPQTNETFQDIAKKYLGSPSKDYIVKYLNPQITEVQTGDPIVLPDRLTNTTNVNNGPTPPKYVRLNESITFKSLAQKYCEAPGLTEKQEAEYLTVYNRERGNPRQESSFMAGATPQTFYLPEEC